MTRPRCSRRLLVARRLWILCSAAFVLCLGGGVGACEADNAGISDAFCHGEADGVRCDDGDPCTKNDRCGQGVCLGRPALDCSDLDGACMVGACDPATVTCVAIAKDDGATCDDGSLCTTADACQQGACGGQAVDCAGEAGPCVDAACDPATGGCALALRDDGEACDDGDRCTIDGVCAAGVCEETAVDCSAFAAACVHAQCDSTTGECVAVPYEEGESCDDDNPCSFGETCVSGLCGGGTLSPDGATCQFADRCRLPGICEGGACNGALVQCPAPADCHVALCDAQTGACGSELSPDGTPCDDRDACTLGEVCTAGACGNGANQCFCRDQADGTPCDDGQRCSAGDACLNGACLGSPVRCSQLDDGVCIVGACNPDTGECVATPVQLGTACDDGLACTAEDRCVGGACVGQVPDCSSLDDACNAGLCREDLGGCGRVPRADGSACDDGDACSGGDSCEGGACKGALDVCAACDGLTVGAGCDDGDPCTTGSICVLRQSALRCEGSPMDCSQLTDACAVGVCDGASGTCRALPRLGPIACDDEVPCTERDTCADGVCSGSPILMCGAQVAQCEPDRANDQRSEAVAIGSDGSVIPLGVGVTVLGWIDPSSETDWWVVPVKAGRLVTIETKPHCGSGLDTLIGVYDAQGNLLAEDDNGGAGDWAKVSGLLTERDETLYVGVSAYGTSGVGSYLLALSAELPPPCRGDGDCACDELTCVIGGPGTGSCVPRMPAESEPNDSPGTAAVLAVGGQLHGALEATNDVDWYRIELAQGVPLALGTRAFCGEGLETELSVYLADGTSQIGFDSGSGQAGHARIERFTPAADGTYLLRVQSTAATTGAYVISVESLLCTSDAGCACDDQVCGGSEAQPGVCRPALDSPPSGPARITVGDRMHGVIGAAFEADRFSVVLAAGTYDVMSAPYCGSSIDTVVEVYGDGALLAADDDGGEGFFGAVYRLVVPAVATYEVLVKGSGPSVGDYLLTVLESAGN